MTDKQTWNWRNIEGIPPKTYTCGYCGKVVGQDRGYLTNNDSKLRIYICSFCSRPTFFEFDKQTPGVAFGSAVAALPPNIQALYNEARNCMSVNSFTSAVLACRKMLMSIAVEQGATPNLTFIAYVEYLSQNGYVPPNGRGWVDHIRKKGNEATHEIILMNQTDAEELISFLEMLLKFIYEFPSRIPPVTP